ncbi:MAG: VOC family protein [Cyanobacteria bacterium J06588_5]
MQSAAFVTLASTQLEKQVEFYSLFLSLAPRVNTPTYAEFQLSGLKLAIFSPKEDHVTEFYGDHALSAVRGPMSLCLEVEDLEGAITLLTTLGFAPPGDIIHASHGQEVYAYDPDGNRLILHQSPS